MRIWLRRVDSDRHELAVEVEGKKSAVVLETKSLLLHDLVHLVVESTLGVDDAFFGQLARGAPLRSDVPDAERVEGTEELWRVESIVGPLQSYWRGRATREGIEALLATTVEAPHDLVAAVEDQLKRLEGAWKATPFHGALCIQWPTLDLRVEQ